jgi:hypothetical protein
LITRAEKTNRRYQERTNAMVVEVLCNVVTYHMFQGERNREGVSRALADDRGQTRSAGAHHHYLFPLVLFGLRVMERVQDAAFEFSLTPNVRWR